MLLVMNGGIGNAVEATPLVYALRTLFPAAHLTLLGPGGDLFDDWPVVDSVLHSHLELAGMIYGRTFITYAAREDLLQGASLGQIERTACLHDRWLIRPEREYNLDLARRLGYTGSHPPLYVSARELAAGPPAAQTRICIAPGGKLEFRWRNKRWPYFSELMGAFLERFHDAQICVLGGANDESDMRLPASERVVDMRGRLSLRETAWLLQTSALAIGNDCGPMHIADAVNCPSVVIFGPTCELKNGPLNRAMVLTQEVACRPCQFGELLMTCNNPICMRELTPAAVLRQAEALLYACRRAVA
jgi:ADP-heptose:LPS heptosyltransferase